MNKRYVFYKNAMLVEIIASLIFSISSLSFKADISLLAFPISLIFTAILAYFHFVKVVKAADGSFAPVVLKLNEYLTPSCVTFILEELYKTVTTKTYPLKSAHIE